MQDSEAIPIAIGEPLNENLFAKLVDRYHSLVFNRCLRLLGHRQDAEDVTQETFSRIVKYFHRWDPSRPIEPWLITIAGNRCRSFLAARKSHQTLSHTVEPSVDTENQVRDAEHLREEIRLVLSTLPTNHKQAFELFHDHHLNYDEISRRLACPAGTAKTWVHRARLKVISQLHARDVISSLEGN